MKCVVHVTRTLRYMEEVEASELQFAEAEVKSAIEQGHCHPYSDESDFEVDNITEEDEDEKGTQSTVVYGLQGEQLQDKVLHEQTG